MSINTEQMAEIDFQVIKEEYTRYLLEDRTVLKVKIPAIKMIESETVDAAGYPTIAVNTTNIVCAIVPDHLKKKPTGTDVDPFVDRPTELDFSVTDEVWQEYHTMDGYKILIRPIVTKVLKYEKYNAFGEPIYLVGNIQQILDIKRIAANTYARGVPGAPT